MKEQLLIKIFANPIAGNLLTELSKKCLIFLISSSFWISNTRVKYQLTNEMIVFNKKILSNTYKGLSIFRPGRVFFRRKKSTEEKDTKELISCTAYSE